jgi:hypothetical protein
MSAKPIARIGAIRILGRWYSLPELERLVAESGAVESKASTAVPNGSGKLATTADVKAARANYRKGAK